MVEPMYLLTVATGVLALVVASSAIVAALGGESADNRVALLAPTAVLVGLGLLALGRAWSGDALGGYEFAATAVTFAVVAVVSG